MIKKNNLAIMRGLFLAFIIFIVIISVVKSDAPIPIDNQNLVDVGKLVSITDKEITAKGVELQTLANGNTQLTFTNSGAEINIGGDKFSNIKTQTEAGLPSSIEFDKNGQIKNAEFTVNERGGNYCFGNTCINAPPNSRVVFRGLNIAIVPPKDSLLVEMPKQKDLSSCRVNCPTSYQTIIFGKNLKLPSGAILNSGGSQAGLYFDEKGQSYIESYDSIDRKYNSKINDIEVISPEKSGISGRINVFFDGKEHPDSNENYISFGVKNLIIQNKLDTPRNFVTVFYDNNPYFPMPKGVFNPLTVDTRPTSKIEINNENNNPLVKATGESFYIRSGDLLFYKDLYDKKISISNSNSKFPKAYSTPMTLDFNDKDGKSFFGGNQIIVDGSNGFKLGRKINYK